MGGGPRARLPTYSQGYEDTLSDLLADAVAAGSAVCSSARGSTVGEARQRRTRSGLEDRQAV